MTFFQEEWEIPDGSKCIPGCFPDGQWCFQEGAGELGQCSFPPDQLPTQRTSTALGCTLHAVLQAPQGSDSSRHVVIRRSPAV